MTESATRAAPNSASAYALSSLCARHPWTVLAVWGVVLLFSGAVFALLSGEAYTTTVERFDDSESTRAESLLHSHPRIAASAQLPNETLVIRAETLTVDDPAFRSHVEAIARRLQDLGSGVVLRNLNYYLTADESLVSADRRSTLMPLLLRNPSRDIGPAQDAARAAGGEHAFRIYSVGRASIGRAYLDLARQDLKAELRIGLPAAIAVLLVVFASVVAGLLPLALALASVMVTLAATALAGLAAPVYFLAANMIVMMGLAVGIDYALFIVSRYREERAAGLGTLDAIAASANTASRAVLYSGATVVFALVGLLLVPTNVFRSLGAGAILVVLVSTLAAFTLLPALLSLLGDRVDALRVPLLRRNPAASGAFWDRITRLATRRPLLSLLVSSTVMIAAAAPMFGMKTGFAGVQTLPEHLDARRGFQLLQDEFAFGALASAIIVIEGRVGESPVREAMLRLRTALEADAAFVVRRATLQFDATGGVAELTVPMIGDAESIGAQDGVRRLRHDHVPRAFDGVPATVLVTGSAAGYIDFFRLTDRYTPVVFTFVLGLSFVLLTLGFRSVVVPLKAIALNLLSVGAAYGLMVLVFQHGVGAALFGFRQVEMIEAWIPLFLFTVLFGLSMDYHVFLLSRMREHFDRTGRNDEAVAFGLRTTGGVITGAAFIMVAIFAGFASGELVMFQQVGFGLAVAVLLDATVVRVIVVPSAMTLLGERNWYLPKWLAWLPRL